MTKKVLMGRFLVTLCNRSQLINKELQARLPHFRQMVCYMKGIQEIVGPRCRGLPLIPRIHAELNCTRRCGLLLGGSICSLPGQFRSCYFLKLIRTTPHYSILRAFIGEIDAARFAGIMAARNEQIASAPAATARANGSHEETP